MRTPRLTRWVTGILPPVAVLALVPLLPAAPADGRPPPTPAAFPVLVHTTAAAAAGTAPADGHDATSPARGHSGPTTARGPRTSGSAAPGSEDSPLATPGRPAPDALLTAAPRWPLATSCTHPDAAGPAGANGRALHPPAGDRFSPISSLGPHLRLRRAYAVRAGRLEPVDGLKQVRACDADLWRVVLTATPVPVRPHLAELVLFDGPDDSPAGQLLGDVEPASDDPGSWRLALRLDGGDNHQLLLTIAHEVAHLVSLGAGQMDRGHTGRDCPTYLTVTGCLRPDSLLMGFLDATWTTALFREWVHADEQPTDASRLAALTAFYARHRTAFVTPYAATSPEEDFAESWASWCVDGPQGTRTGRARTGWLGRALAPEHDVTSGCAVLRGLAARG